MGVVLATNDDGIGAPGLRALVEELAREGHEVYVVAPRGPESGTGKALRFPAAYGGAHLSHAREAWWVDSTPAGAVFAGLRVLLPRRPDVVVSGVNRGPNMGLEDFFTSGTIGAAVEAALQGVPGIAVSLATDAGLEPGDYRVAARLASRLASLVAAGGPPRGARVLVLNVPEGTPRGVRVARMAWNNYRIEVRAEGRSLAPVRHGYRSRYWDAREGSDVQAVLSGYASLTPVCLESLASPPPGAAGWAAAAARELEGALALGAARPRG
ncbi:MAG: 5'/3'-nucleotidase SurE [Desulfurococcales archaeon]|nr:5'/3'-nucleotidase SurE [Desulfurococcales archaeon]